MKKFCPGFSLVELLIAASILGLLTTFGLARFHQFNRRQIFDQAVQELKNNLRFAQEKALAGEKPSDWCTAGHLQGYQLKFNTSSNYLIEAICSDDEISARQVKSIPLLDPVSGPIDEASVLFKVLAQGVDEEKTFTLSFTGMDDKSVTVTKTGEIK